VSTVDRIAYRQGIAAHARHETLVDCPYIYGFARSCWMLGWQHAEARAKGVEPEMPAEIEL
jgi:ribosome modulation factor